jgi:hypothetical protein
MTVSSRPPDSVAFEEMVKPHLDYLYGLALRLSGRPTEAEDLVQEDLLKAFRAFPGLRNRDRPRLWLTRVITSMQPKTNHYLWTDQAAVVQVHGIGPWGINYVNPADDPRKK